MSKAIDCVKQFSNKEGSTVSSELDLLGTETVAKIRSALYEETPTDVLPEGELDFEHVEGLDPDMAISTSLSEEEGQVVRIVSCHFVENLFASQREGAEPYAGEFIFQKEDGKFYRAVSGNKFIVKQARILERLLTRFGSIRARVASVPVQGQANGAACFAGTAGSLRDSGELPF